VPNPEQGPQEQGIIGTWQTISLEIPDFFEPVREAIDAFFSFLIQILNILIAVLEILKVFCKGLLDPIITIIETIRRIIEALLNDLRQLGIYIHGDFYAMEGPDFQALKGGYLQYERRMLARLQDTNDPNRPNVSEFSTCIALFLFVGTDIRGVHRIVQLIRSILGLFRRKYPMRLHNQVSDIQATYGYDGATIFSFNKGLFRGFDFTKESVDENLFSPYNAVNLTWQMSPIPGAPFPDTQLLPPAGFLVEFSTLEQPIKIVCERPIEGTTETVELANQPAKIEVVDCLDEDGNPILIRGGLDGLNITDAVNWNDAVDFQGKRKADAVRAYGIKNLSDRSPIALDLLEGGGKHFIQKTFFVPFAQNIFFPGKGFGATFLFEDMPFSAEFELNTGLFSDGKIKRINDDNQPEQFFVRVRAVNRSVKSNTDYQFTIDQTSLRDHDGPVLPLKNADEVDLNDAGPPSPVARILFPDASTQVYLRAVGEALAILALSRADIPVVLGQEGELVDFPPAFGQALANGLVDAFWQSYQDSARKTTELEDLAQFLMPQLIGRRQSKKFFQQANAPVTRFRKKLFINCINLTNRFLTQNMPPLSARQLAVSRAEDLLNFQILRSPSGTILSTVDPNFTPEDLQGGSPLELLQETDSDWGVGPNQYSMDITDTVAQDRLVGRLGSQVILPRSPHFFFAANPTNTEQGVGSFDMACVVYSRQNNTLQSAKFFRNLVPDSVYAGARDVLQIAVGPAIRPKERGWIAFRVFPQGIPSLDRFFDQIIALLRSIQAAIESIAETIIRYIEFLQSRLRELQAFLNRINALIQRLLRFFFAIQPAAGLLVVAPGTDGVTTALMGSGNKPVTPPPALEASYGGGIVLFAGGIPNLVLDVFRALFKGDD
jgi:hypothetical protein